MPRDACAPGRPGTYTATVRSGRPAEPVDDLARRHPGSELVLAIDRSSTPTPIESASHSAATSRSSRRPLVGSGCSRRVISSSGTSSRTTRNGTAAAVANARTSSRSRTDPAITRWRTPMRAVVANDAGDVVQVHVSSSVAIHARHVEPRQPIEVERPVGHPASLQRLGDLGGHRRLPSAVDATDQEAVDLIRRRHEPPGRRRMAAYIWPPPSTRGVTSSLVGFSRSATSLVRGGRDLRVHRRSGRCSECPLRASR